VPPRQRVPALSGAPAHRPSPVDPLELLSRGELDVVGRIVGASNATLVATVALDGQTARCVYKPISGERPLWDFPDGTLAEREVAAWVLSSGAGWDVVPPTVLRDGPYGAGSVQLWVGPAETTEEDLPEAPEAGAGLIDVVPPRKVPPGWCTVVEGEGARGGSVFLVHADDDQLRRMACFDVLANNADRKGGHVLRDPAGKVWGVDHGLTFHEDTKLRTVLWGWAGQPLGHDVAGRVRATAAALEGSLAEELRDLLTEREVEVLGERVQRLLDRGRFPKPRPGGPALPWPPF
jgi:uncharacterized repeat protein (TIGR03843 family)